MKPTFFHTTSVFDFVSVADSCRNPREPLWRSLAIRSSGRVLFAIAILLCAGLSSCTKPQAPPTKRYPFTGRVVSIDRQAQSALIDGDMIQGYMEAMAMPYTFKPPSEFTKVSPGDRISAEVVVIDNPDQRQDHNDPSQPDYWLENVKVTQHVKPADHAELNPSSIQHIPTIGEEVPDFHFINQNGQATSLAQYRGKILFLTFIYTRCPFPDYCPRVSNNFAKIYTQLAGDGALSSRLRLLSVSFDPAHDTPKILRQYGLSLVSSKSPALFEKWQFAVPGKSDLPKIAAYFALTYQPDSPLITHSLSTAVIGPDGKIVKWYHGSDWQATDLLQDASAILHNATDDRGAGSV